MDQSTAGISIEIYSDVVCPWCYIGKRRLERALDQLNGAAEARITWRPFQLNPTMSLDGMDRAAYLEAKFGSLDAFRQMEEQVIAAGVEERIPFAFDKIQQTPNTFAAHRVIWHADRLGKQDAMVETLFRVYFVEGQNIGNVKTLIQAATEAGLDRAETESWLSSDEGVAEVKAEEAVGHRMGIRSVPYFVLNGTYAISGAQTPDRFVSTLRKAEADYAGRKAGV
ncbi:MAG: hypothetical protein EWM72_01173 [Nitrospira sp.]|nr:MAG: hypothetical protein EWM72_01173 [Nitrospira sp.]